MGGVGVPRFLLGGTALRVRLALFKLVGMATMGWFWVRSDYSMRKTSKTGSRPYWVFIGFEAGCL